MKKVVSLVLAIMLVFCSIPMLSFAASADDSQISALHITQPSGVWNPVVTRVQLQPSTDYTFAFSISSNAIAPGETGTTNMTIKTYNGNASALNNDNLVSGLTAELDDVHTLSENSNYKRYTYTFTTPSTLPADGVFIGIITNNTNYYLFNVMLVDENDDEVSINGQFESGLDHWLFGNYTVWFENFSNGKLGKTSWSGSYSTLDVVPLVVSPSAMAEQGEPDRMIYYKNSAVEIFASRFTATASKMYYFSFNIASTVDVSKIGIGAYGNGNRTKLTINPQLIDRVEHGNYAFVTYSVTMPANLSSVADSNMVYLGMAIPANNETYIFNMAVYDPLTVAKTNLFDNKVLASINCMSVGQWTAIPSNNYCSEGSFVKEVQSDSVTRPVAWTNTGKELRVMDFDSTKFPTKKMLYFNSASTGLSFRSRVNLTASTTYDLSFSLSRNIPQNGGFGIMNKRDYYDGTNIGCTITPVSAIDNGEYITYTYTVQTPSSVPNNYGMIGIWLVGNQTGYMFDWKLTKQSDTSKVNQFDNGSFGAGLNSWACNTDAWFISDVSGLGKTNWKRADDQQVTVKNFSIDEIASTLQKKMLHYSGKVSGDDKSNLGQKVTLTKGHTYKVEFDFHAFEGALDQTCYLTLNKMVTRSGKLCVDAPIVADFLVENNQFTRTIDAENNIAEFTFTLSDSLASNLPDSGTYALCLTSKTTQYNTDMYISNMVMYDVADANHTNILPSNNYTDNVGEWVAYWDTATSGVTSFTQQGCTVSVANYDETKFPTVKQMLYFKETKKNGFDVFVQKIKSLEADVEYTISMDYYFKSGAFNDTFYFGLFGGPGANDMVYKTQYRASMENNLSTTFDTTVDTGKNIKYTFTLTQAEIDKNTDFYAGLYLLPDPDMITEMYIADLKIYKTNDPYKTNVFADNEYSTKINNWRANYGNSYLSNVEFSRGDIEFTAKYIPYVGDYFATDYSADKHYGDANADGSLNILDLVTMKKTIANTLYFALSDMNDDSAVNSSDVVAIINILLDKADKTWTATEIALDKFDAVGGSDVQAAAKKDSIVNSENNVTASGTTYYISDDGDDSNNGTSTSTPIKTIAKLKTLTLNSGDTVLFRRGDTFRTDSRITVKSGVKYSAYGTGAKPKLLGSVKNYADSSIWTSTDAYVWSTVIPATNAANVVFNDGESVGTRKSTIAALSENGDFYFDSATNTVYLFMAQMNPGNQFDSIEISSSDYIFYGMGSNASTSLYIKNVTITNLDIEYAATHAIYFAFVDGITINNCSIGWAGGEYQSGTNNTVRLGNAIQLWRIAKNSNISNNYIYQAFDAALTFQGTSNNEYSGLTFENNLIEYCSMNFEFWANDNNGDLDSNASLTNISFNNNILRFGGMGFGGIQRTDKINQAYVLTWNANFASTQVSNFQIKNNIFDIANSNYFYAKNTVDNITISGNTYYQTAGSAHQFANGYSDYVNNQSEFETAIAKIEASPASVSWIS